MRFSILLLDSLGTLKVPQMELWVPYPSEPRAPSTSKAQGFCVLSSGTLHPLICSRTSSRSPFLSGPELLTL